MNELDYVSYEMGFPTLANEVTDFPLIDKTTNSAVNVSHKDNDRYNNFSENSKQQEFIKENSKYIYALF